MEATNLLYRIASLEVELRLSREQCSKAENTILHLVRTFTQHQSSEIATPAEYSALKAEVAELRQLLETLSSSRDEVRKTPPETPDAAIIDLLDFNDNGPICSNINHGSTAQPATGRPNNRETAGTAAVRDHHNGDNSRIVPYYIHQHVLNAATFTEEMPADEQDAVFSSYARRFPELRMGKLQWRHYYNNVVREEFLEKRPQSADRKLNVSTDLSAASSSTNAGPIKKIAEHKDGEADEKVEVLCVGNTSQDATGEQDVVESTPVFTAVVETENNTLSLQHSVHPPALQNITASPPPQALETAIEPVEIASGPVNISVEGITNRGPWRSVLITFIPCETDLATILDHVKAGPILTASYIKTNGMRTRPATNTNTVILIFSEKHIAEAFVQACSISPLQVISESGYTAKLHTSIIQSPSPRIPYVIQRSIAHHKASRKLLVQNNGGLWSLQSLTTILSNPRGGVCRALRVTEVGDDNVRLEFASINTAIDARKKLVEAHGIISDFFLDAYEQPDEQKVHGIADSN